ncbi:MAG TPA: ATP-dependent DNA ligase, partial [Acidimicrobiales bacterium]|nr:ATP-dependent DNA ligase [Acidimicrobiales bacterium]
APLTAAERNFLLSLLAGGLRQGAAAGVMAEAVAQAAGTPPAAVRRALLVAGDLPAVAAAALDHRLGEFRLEVLRPLRPMLAQSAPSAAEALARICPAAVEWKVDGVRVQIHRRGPEVRVFTRNLADVTSRLPEVVRAVAGGPPTFVLDGELIALDAGGRPRRFQETMGRFANEGTPAVTLTTFLFDCLHLDGEDLIDRPEAERFAALAGAFAPLAILRAVLDEPAAAEAFLDDALAAGHEGIMVKALDAPYEAGRRGAGWLKVKRALTLDLVVLAAEWGHGRRRGYLSNLHLGARGEDGSFVMLGKTFKGMTDQMLAWQTERLAALETRREGITVYVRPELVVEVAFDGIQQSSRYPGGMALRFARIKAYRADKSAQEADTIGAVRALFDR